MNTYVKVSKKRCSCVSRMGLVSGLADSAKHVRSQESNIDVVNLEWGNPSSNMQPQYPEEKSTRADRMRVDEQVPRIMRRK